MALTERDSYLNKDALVEWSTMVEAQKKAMEELFALQERQNEEFVEKHGLPAQAKTRVDDVLARYGAKAIRRHLDEYIIKSLSTAEPKMVEDNLEKWEEAVSLISLPDKKTKAVELLEQAKKTLLDVKAVNEITLDDEPVIAMPQKKVMGARSH